MEGADSCQGLCDIGEPQEAEKARHVPGATPDAVRRDTLEKM